MKILKNEFFEKVNTKFIYDVNMEGGKARSINENEELGLRVAATQSGNESVLIKTSFLLDTKKDISTQLLNIIGQIDSLSKKGAENVVEQVKQEKIAEENRIKRLKEQSPRINEINKENNRNFIIRGWDNIFKSKKD